MTKKHPMQPIALDQNGVIRFKKNAIVEYMLEAGRAAKIFDLNSIAMMDFSEEDRMQLAQLIGYSVSGYADLSYVSDESCDEAEAQLDSLEKHILHHKDNGPKN